MTNNILICPICKSSLVKKEKNFKCLKYHKFLIEDDIGILLSDPEEHINSLKKQMQGKEDWYESDQISSYDSGPYKIHLRKRREYVQNIISRVLNKEKAGKILDVGCGDGANLQWLSDLTDDLWGIDYNLLRLKRAKKIGKKLEIDTKLFVANILSLPFSENSFDIIFFNHVIEHIVKDEIALKKIFDEYVDELRSRKLLFRLATKTELINLQKKISFILSKGNKSYNYFLGVSACAQAVRIQHALELLETQTLKSFNRYLNGLKEQAMKKQSKGVTKLASKHEFNFALKKSSDLLEKNIEHPKIQTIVDIIEKEKLKNSKTKIIVFTQFRETADILSKRLEKLKNLRAKIFVGQAKKETTGMTQKEQKKIINEFSNGDIDVLCATCIGEEGLDIPEVNIVIFYEPVSSAIRTIQRAGRTARLMKGKLIILITKKTRDEIYYYVSRKREKKMHSLIDSIKEELRNGPIKSLKQKTIGNYS